MKQGILNRLRVWFDRELIVFPYASADMRKKIGIILDELENHVWKNGEIVDVGKHNDTVMAFAHAIDQFKPKRSDFMPMASRTTSMGGWSKDKKPTKTARNRGSGGKYVRF